MAKFALPSGATFEAPADLTDEEVSRYAVENFPDEYPEYQSAQPRARTQPRLRPGQEEPGLLGRFVGSFAEGLSRGTGSVLPGLGAGFSDLIGDEQGFQGSLQGIKENSAEAAELNPLPSSFAEVRQKYREDGLGSAMLEMADLAAQGTGGSLAYVAPSLAVVGLGAAGVLSAPATVLALGGAAGISMIQYFSEQLDRANEEAEAKGEKLSSEDVNLAKQLAFAMGQTALDRASLLTTGVFRGLAKNEAVRSAANSAAARTILDWSEKAVAESAAARAVVSGLSEVVTETGQTAFERAAAGLPVAPENQKDLDEYIETWVSAMLVGTGLGGAMGHMDNRAEKHRPGIEDEPTRGSATDAFDDLDPAEVESITKPSEPIYTKAELEARDKAKKADERYRAEQINVISQIRKSDAALADRIEAKLGGVSKAARKTKKKFRSEGVAVADSIRKRDRTAADVYNLLDHRKVDFESTPEAKSRLDAFLQREGVNSLEEAKPSQLERIYKTIEKDPTGSLADPSEAKVVSKVLEQIAKNPKGLNAEGVRRVVFKATGDTQAKTQGIAPVKPAPGAKPIKTRIKATDLAKPVATAVQPTPTPAPTPTPVDENIDADLDPRTAAVLGRMVDSGIVKRVKGTTGRFKYVASEDVSRYFKSPTLEDVSMPEKAKVSAPTVAAANPEFEYEKIDTPKSRWVVRDKDGKVRRVERSRKKAENFFMGSSDKSLVEPRLERGVVVREHTYAGEGENRRLVKSVPANFFEGTGTEAQTQANEWVKQQSQAAAELVDDTHFLGTKARGEAGSIGRVSKLQRMARSGNPADFKEAVNMVRTGRNPLAANRVIKSYGFGVEPNSPETRDVHTDGEVDLKIPISLTGRLVKKFFPVTVKAGKLMPNGKGFGVAKISSHDFASTKYGSWRSALDKVVTEMGNEQSIRTGRMTVFPDGYGRIVAILQEPKSVVTQMPEIDVEAEIAQLYEDAPKIYPPGDYRGAKPQIDPQYHSTLKKRAAEIRENARFLKENPGLVRQRLSETSEPITAIFDMVTDDQGKPSYHVVNMFVGKKDMTVEMHGPDQAKGHEPFYGKGASPRSIAILNTPANAMKFPTGGAPAVEVTYSSPTQRSAKGLKVAPEKKPNTIWKYISDAITEWTGKPDLFMKLRMAYVDSGAFLQKTEGKFLSDASREMLVSVGTMGSYRLVTGAANFSNSSLHSGFVEYTPTETVLDAEQKPMQSIEGVFTTQDFKLNDESEELLVTDKASGRLIKKKFKVDGMYSDKLGNTHGGHATIWTSAVVDGKNLVGQMFDYAMAVRAWNMINVEGKDTKLVPKYIQENMSTWLDFPNQHPEIGVAYSNMQRLNQHAIDLIVKTGLRTRADGDAMLKNFDYTPFMVEQTGDANIFDKLIGGVNNIDPTMAYKGWFDEKDGGKMVDPMQAFLGNYTRIIASAINNITRSRAIRDQIALGLARPWKNKLGTGSKIAVFENGVSVDYEIDDPIAFESIQGELGKDWGQVFRNSQLKWVTTKPSEWLRESVSRSPDFALTNPIRDSFQAMMINGLGFKKVGEIWHRVAVNMGKAASGKEMSRSFGILKKNAVITGWGHVGFQGSVKDVVGDLNADFASRADGRGRSAVGKAWDLLGRWSAASESASREIVFEDSYNYWVNELQGDPTLSADQAEKVAVAQALNDAREVMNFQRHGNSQFLKALLQLAPFTGARIQGLDIVGRALFGYAPVGYKRMSADQVRRAVAQRAGIIAAGSAALAMLNYGDDDYEEEDGYVRDMNWLFPVPGTKTHIALPIPFELGIISKVLPEQITRFLISAIEGESNRGGRDAARAARHAVVNTVGLSGFLPVVSRPFIEKFSNKSIFTGKPIVPFYEEMKPTSEQYGSNTTIQARGLSSAGLDMVGVSPRLIDTEVRTIGGGLGVYAWSIMDHVARLVLPGVPNNPVPRPSDMVGLKRFVKDEFSAGVQSEIYEFQRELDQSFSRMKNASRENRAALAKELAPDNAVRPSIHKLTARLKKQRDRMDAIKDSDMSGIQKRMRIDEIDRVNGEIFKLYREIRSRHDAMR